MDGGQRDQHAVVDIAAFDGVQRGQPPVTVGKGTDDMAPYPGHDDEGHTDPSGIGLEHRAGHRDTHAAAAIWACHCGTRS